jgi:hypothetical protein
MFWTETEATNVRIIKRHINEVLISVHFPCVIQISSYNQYLLAPENFT